MNTHYSVIIPTLNRPELLEKCLVSLKAQTLLPYEIVIVDQSDNEETCHLFEKLDLGKIKKVYKHSSVKGLTLSRNLGIDLTSAESAFIGFLDDDMELLPNYYEKLLHRFQMNASLSGGMGSVVGLPQSHPQKEPFLSFFFIPHFKDGRFLPNGLPTFPHTLNSYSEDVEFLSGGMALFKREILLQYKYDENLKGFGHGDDWDITYRISRKHKLFYEPEALMYHFGGAPGKDMGDKHRKEQITNAFYLIRKNTDFPVKTKVTFGLFVTGLILDDFRNKRLRALKGDLKGVYQLLKQI